MMQAANFTLCLFCKIKRMRAPYKVESPAVKQARRQKPGACQPGSGHAASATTAGDHPNPPPQPRNSSGQVTWRREGGSSVSHADSFFPELYVPFHGLL